MATREDTTLPLTVPLPGGQPPPLFRLGLIGWLGAAVSLGVLSVLGMALWISAQQALEESRNRADVLSRILERSVTRTLESVELSLVALGEAVQNDHRQASLHTLPTTRQRMADTLRFAPHLRQIAVVRNGIVLADSAQRGEGQALDLARLGLAGFDAAAGGFSLGLKVGETIPARFLPLVGDGGGPSPQSIMTIGLEAFLLEGTSPEPLLIVAALNPDYFTGLFAEGQVGRAGHIALLRTDGLAILGALSPAPTPATIRAMSAHEQITRLEETTAQITALRLSSRFPVVLGVSLSHRETLSRWLATNRLVLGGVAVLSLVMLFSMALLLREAVRRTRLQQQVYLLFQAVEQSSTIVVITDQNQALAYINPAFTRLYGYQRAEILGKNPGFLGSGLTRKEVYEDLRATLARGETWRGEFLNQTRSGDPVDIAATISAVANSQGQVTHYIGVMEDITQRKVMEAEREGTLRSLSRSNEEMMRLAEVMAHHFQEPSRRLVSFAQRLAHSPALTVDADAAISIAFIDEQARRLRSLTQDIQQYLLLSQMDYANAPAVSAKRAVEEAAAACRHKDSTADCSLSVTTPLPMVCFPERTLTTLFTVLLENAIKYRRPDVPLRVEISAELHQDRALFRVADNGSGIAPQYRQQVFSLFARLVPNSIPGTGMGLALLYKCVHGAGGQVRIDDGLEGGVCITFDLPLALPQDQAREAP